MFKLIGHAGGQTEVSAVDMYGSGVIGIGDVVAKKSGLGVIRANDALNSIEIGNIIGVAASSINNVGTTSIKVVPIVAGQIWEADCTSNSDENQILCRNSLTTAGILANSSTDSKATSGVFLVYKPLGSASSKKVIGEFVRVTNEFGI